MDCCFPCCWRTAPSLDSDESIKLVQPDPLAKLFSDNQISTGSSVVMDPTKNQVTAYGGKFEISSDTIKQFEFRHGPTIYAAKEKIKKDLVTSWANDHNFDHKKVEEVIKNILGNQVSVGDIQLIFRMLCLQSSPLNDFESNFMKLLPHH